MLIEFKVANYRSFREEQTLSMVASRDKAHPDSLIPCNGESVFKVAAVYGPNASGKSNLIHAMRAMERFVLASATRMNLGDSIDFVSPFRLDSATRGEPSRFEITVLIEQVTYVYGFSATSECIHGEWLHVRRPGGRLTTWLDRALDTDTGQTAWQIKGPLKKESQLLRSKTRDNGLLLSRGAELNVKCLAPLFFWFRKHLWIFDLSFPPIGLAQGTAELIHKDDTFRTKVLRLMHNADFGISDIRAKEPPAQRPLFPDEASDAVTELAASLKRLAAYADTARYSVMTQHTDARTGEAVTFSLEDDESNGTQRLFALAGPILEALAEGDLLVIDELDCSIHPLLMRKLIDFFQDPEHNSNGAQLVFATHDSSIMDSTLFRRDQVWLTEKRQDGSTDLFSLYDFDSAERPRKSEAFERNYLAGRYGAVPRFGPLFEDLANS